MNIILATCGSRGDVQPLIALALALQTRGHHVVVCAPPENAAWVTSHHCQFQPIGNNVMNHISQNRETSTLRALKNLIRFIQNELKVQCDQLPQLVKNADLILYSSLLLSTPTIAESLSIPCYYIGFCPQMLPSNAHPMFHVRNHTLPAWLNRLSWTLFHKLDINLNYRSIINKERKKRNLSPIKDVWSNILGKKILIASDPILAPVPNDVSSCYTQTGYLHLAQNDPLSDKIKQFLQSGPPPLYVGFGSMPCTNPEQTIELLHRTMQSTKQRCIVSKGTAQLDKTRTSNDMMIIDSCNHTLLFPHMAAIIHHGGAGTTATAAKAGIPQIIIPHIMDQFYWGHQIYSKQLGPKPLFRHKLTEKKLIERISSCISNKIFYNTAKHYASQINAQTPLQNAVKWIEHLPE